MSFLSQNIEGTKTMLSQMRALEPQVNAAAIAIAQTLLAGGKLLACGNGGSAADASHLTTEFVCRFNNDRKPYAALSLATHGATSRRSVTTTPSTISLHGRSKRSAAKATC